MAIAGVPLWQGTQDAIHSAEDLRMMTYFMMRGQEGFLTNTAGRARPLDTPGGGILLGQGPFIVNSQFPGGSMQSYMTRIISDHQVDLEPNNTNATVYDLVVCNIEDPEPSGGTNWPYPSPPGSNERKYGPYWRPRVIPNVPNYTVTLDDLPTNRPERSWSAIPSCLLTRTPFSNYITGVHIKPLNQVCNPFSGLQLPAGLYDNISGLLTGRIQVPGEFVDSIDCTFAVDGTNTLNYTQSTAKKFPKDAEWDVLIPPWATYCEAFIINSGVYQKATAANQDANVNGFLYLFLGDYSAGFPKVFDSPEVNSNDNRSPSPGDSTAYQSGYRPGQRIDLVQATDFAIDPRDRNKKVKVRQFAAMAQNTYTRGKLIADSFSSVYIGLKFKEKP